MKKYFVVLLLSLLALNCATVEPEKPAYNVQVVPIENSSIQNLTAVKVYPDSINFHIAVKDTGEYVYYAVFREIPYGGNVVYFNSDKFNHNFTIITKDDSLGYFQNAQFAVNQIYKDHHSGMLNCMAHIYISKN